MFVVNPGVGSNVFYNSAFIRRHWGRFVEVLSITPRAHGYQTAVVLTRP